MADVAVPAYLHLAVGRGSPLGAVIDAERDFHAIAKSVAHEVAGASPFDWILDQVMESDFLRFRITPDLSSKGADPLLAKEVVDAIAGGIEFLTENASPPDFYAYKSLEYVQRLASRRRQLGHVSILNGSRGAEIDGRLVVNLATALRPSFTEYGSIEGRLEGMNIHAKSRYFRIYDPLTNQGVRCHFGARIPLDSISAGIGRRVLVGGEIDYRADGSPQDCRAHDIYVFPSDDNLPDVRSMRGILSDE